MVYLGSCIIGVILAIVGICPIDFATVGMSKDTFVVWFVLAFAIVEFPF